MGLLAGIKTHRRQSEMVVELVFLNNLYCCDHKSASCSPAAPKLLFLHKKSIILSLSYRRRRPRRLGLACRCSFVHFGKPLSCTDRRFPRAPGSKMWLAFWKNSHFHFFNSLKIKCPCSKRIWRRSPYDLALHGPILHFNRLHKTR